MKNYTMNQKKNAQGQTYYEVCVPGVGIYETPYCNDSMDAYKIAIAAANYIIETGEFPGKEGFFSRAKP